MAWPLCRLVSLLLWPVTKCLFIPSTPSPKSKKKKKNKTHTLCAFGYKREYESMWTGKTEFQWDFLVQASFFFLGASSPSLSSSGWAGLGREDQRFAAAHYLWETDLGNREEPSVPDKTALLRCQLNIANLHCNHRASFLSSPPFPKFFKSVESVPWESHKRIPFSPQSRKKKTHLIQ